MTYGQMRDRILMLLNQYSIAGGKIAVTYNNQQDYINRIPALINDGLLYVATTARRMRKTARLKEGSRAMGGMVFPLPEDCWQVCAGGVFQIIGDGELRRCSTFRLLGEDEIVVPGDGMWMVEYFRYPRQLAQKPAEEDAVDCPEESAAAVACYAAAALAGSDDVYLQAVLQNEFENRLSRLGEAMVAMRERVLDAYEGWEAME